MEQHCARLRHEGENPAIVVDKLRPHTQRIWQAFSAAERQAFVQRYAAPRLYPPFNKGARGLAGFTDEELAFLES